MLRFKLTFCEQTLRRFQDVTVSEACLAA